MPWRHNPTPYRVWVSEVMLQQTQVPTVRPYFDRFMCRFPCMRTLANAPLQDVLHVWQGLGYYSRARCLHQTAQVVVNNHAGRLPRSASSLRQLPGIGAYTAAAIASIAFQEIIPVVDGNVRRVAARYRARNDTPATLYAWLQRAIPSNRPGDFNQALMELGRLVCKPRGPSCPSCPLRKACRARQTGQSEAFPVKPKRNPIPCYDVVACILQKKGQFLVARRRADQMLGGLWEFPGGKVEPNETLSQAARREIREELGLNIEPSEVLGVVKHAYSHFKIVLHAMHCRLVRGTPFAHAHDEIRWIRPNEFKDLPFPVTDQRIIQMLLNDNG